MILVKYTHSTIALTLVVSLLAACGGRIAHPVETEYFQDTMKDCNMLEEEMALLQHDIITLEPYTNKAPKNDWLALSSLVLLFPALFIDIDNADYIEYHALRQRYNHLLVISHQKKCATTRPYLNVDHRFEDKFVSKP
jgi:hypothetical protein